MPFRQVRLVYIPLLIDAHREFHFCASQHTTNSVLSGRTWSDGSIWRHSRLYNRNSQLSSTTCCIKATWGADQYNWFGEVCDALHPAICEYRPNGEGEARLCDDTIITFSVAVSISMCKVFIDNL